MVTKKSKIFILGAIEFIIIFSLSAQSTSFIKDMDNLSIGPVVSQPYLKNEFTAPYPWFGTEIMFGSMHFSFLQGEYFREGAISREQALTGFIFQGGITIPFIPWLSEGKFSFETLRIIPFFDSGFTYAEIGVDGPEDKAFSWGLMMGPGVRFRIPFIFIDIRTNGQLLFNNSPIFEKDNENAFSGLSVSPSLTIGIDGLYEILSPAKFQKTFSQWITKFEITDSTTRYVVDRGDFDGDGNYNEILERTTETVRSWQEIEHKTYKYTLGPSFWGFGLKSILHPGSKNWGYTAMAGPILDGRYGPWALDVYYQYGISGEPGGGAFKIEPIEENPVHIFGVTAGMDIIKAGMPASMRPDNNKGFFSKDVSMLRILGRGSYQIISESNSGQNGFIGGIGMGIGLELGAAAMSWDYFWYQSQPERNTGVFSFSILAPWPRIFDVVKSQRLSSE